MARTAQASSGGVDASKAFSFRSSLVVPKQGSTGSCQPSQFSIGIPVPDPPDRSLHRTVGLHGYDIAPFQVAHPGRNRIGGPIRMNRRLFKLICSKQWYSKHFRCQLKVGATLWPCKTDRRRFAGEPSGPGLPTTAKGVPRHWQRAASSGLWTQKEQPSGAHQLRRGCAGPPGLKRVTCPIGTPLPQTRSAGTASATAQGTHPLSTEGRQAPVAEHQAMQSPGGATHFLPLEMCRPFGPVDFKGAAVPGLISPGRGCAGPPGLATWPSSYLESTRLRNSSSDFCRAAVESQFAARCRARRLSDS